MQIAEPTLVRSVNLLIDIRELIDTPVELENQTGGYPAIKTQNIPQDGTLKSPVPVSKHKKSSLPQDTALDAIHSADAVPLQQDASTDTTSKTWLLDGDCFFTSLSSKTKSRSHVVLT